MSRVIGWALALLVAGLVGGFLVRLLWPERPHPSSASSVGSYADAIRAHS